MMRSPGFRPLSITQRVPDALAHLHGAHRDGVVRPDDADLVEALQVLHGALRHQERPCPSR